MTVESGGKITSLTALLDSGNELRDPLTSKPVTVVSRDAFFEILPPEFAPAKALDDPVECFEMLRRLSSGQSFRLISYTALGVEGGMLPALRADAVTVGRRRREGMLVACAPGEISKHGGYTALAGTDV